jgi:hypothetical protein
MVNNLSYSDPKTAAGWAEKIADEKQRTSRMESIGYNWIRQDPTGAQAWLSTAPLSDQSKQRILKQLNNE